MSTFAIALVSILFSVAAQFSLKAGMSSEAVRASLAQPFSIKTTPLILFNGHIVLGFLLYGLGAVVWLMVLSRWEVSKAYPIVGLGFLFTALVGYWLGEAVSVYRLAGIALICVGILLVGKN
jgi:multidrug transporter EmrE-like cation transporter